MTQQKNIITYILFLSLLLLPSFAINWNIDVYQWQNVNKTTPYLNEFMVCYLKNATHIHYDTYQSGVAEIVLADSEAGLSHDLKCCDNCYVEGGILKLAKNSLHYELELNMTFNSSINLNYYVGDISDYLRIGSAVVGTLDQLEGGNDFLLGMGILLVFIIFIPVLLMMAFPSADLHKMLSMGGSIGLVLGLGTIIAYDLLNLGQSIVVFIFSLVLLLIIGGLNRG